MTRRESMWVLIGALCIITAGLTWLFGDYGAYGLILGGLAIAAIALFADGKPEERRAEPVPDAVPQPPRHRALPQ